MNELLQWIENQGVAIAMLIYMIWKDNTTMKDFTKALTELTNSILVLTNEGKNDNEKI